MTEEQCRKCRNDFVNKKIEEGNRDFVTVVNKESQSEKPLNISLAKSKDTYVSGHLRWRDDDGNLHPLRGVKIEVYDEDNNDDDFLGTTYADDNGYYSLTFQNKDGFFDFENGGLDIYIRVFAEDSGNVKVTRADGSSYSFDSSVRDNVETGSNTDIGSSAGEAYTMNNDYGQALQIFQALYTARNFAKVLTYETPSNITLYYPGERSLSGAECYYNRNNRRINIIGKNEGGTKNNLFSYSSWDVLMHEYGHHISYDRDINKSPGGNHYVNTNDADKLNSNINGARLSWSESWATIFALMAQDYYREKLTNIRSVSDFFYTSYSLNSPINIEYETLALGESCEQSIMAVLWDLFDGNNENENDTLTLGVAGFRDVTLQKGTYTFSDCINNFYRRYPDYKEAVFKNLQYYKMAPGAILVQNNKLNSLPKFSWTASGGSTKFPNNAFDLHFYCDEGYEILSIKDIGSNSYILNEKEWNTILQTDGGEYYCSVGGYSNYNNFKTGPYYSSLKKINKPNINSVDINKSQSINLSYLSNNWIKFTTQSSGIYEISTNGSSDTYGELFLYPVYSDGIENRLTYDDNSGENNNFKISYTLAAEREYYLRITKKDTITNTNLMIYFKSHVHNYTYRCVKKDRDMHKGYCYCGITKDEKYTYDMVGTKYKCIYCDYIVGSVSGGSTSSVGGVPAGEMSVSKDILYAIPEKREYL